MTYLSRAKSDRYGVHAMEGMLGTVDCVSSRSSYLDSLGFDISLPDGLTEYNTGRSDEVSKTRVNIELDYYGGN